MFNSYAHVCSAPSRCVGLKEWKKKWTRNEHWNMGHCWRVEIGIFMVTGLQCLAFSHLQSVKYHKTTTSFLGEVKFIPGPFQLLRWLGSGSTCTQQQKQMAVKYNTALELLDVINTTSETGRPIVFSWMACADYASFSVKTLIILNQILTMRLSFCAASSESFRIQWTSL